MGSKWGKNAERWIYGPDNFAKIPNSGRYNHPGLAWVSSSSLSQRRLYLPAERMLLTFLLILS